MQYINEMISKPFEYLPVKRPNIHLRNWIKIINGKTNLPKFGIQDIQNEP